MKIGEKISKVMIDKDRFYQLADVILMDVEDEIIFNVLRLHNSCFLINLTADF